MKLTALITAFIIYQTAWVTYTSNNPGFSIQFPGKIEEKFKIIKTDIGQIEINTLYHVSTIDSTGNTLYLLNYYKLDTAIFYGDSAVTKREYIENTIENIAAGLKGKVLYSNIEKDKNGIHAIYRIEYDNEKKSMKGKIVLAGNYLFSLQVFTDRQHSLNRNIEKFLNSFYLINTAHQKRGTGKIHGSG